MHCTRSEKPLHIFYFIYKSRGTKKGMLLIYIVQSALLQFSQELTAASHSHKNNVCKLAAARIIVMMIHPGIKFPSDVVFRRSMTSGRFITMGFLCSGYGLIITDAQHRASWLLLSAGVSQHRCRLLPGPDSPRFGVRQNARTDDFTLHLCIWLFSMHDIISSSAHWDEAYTFF